MDPYSFDINSARELRLRKHIREVLLPYARTHLTSDYVAFTEVVVEELLLRALEYVPMADATSFLLPTDPFEVLMCSLDSLDLTPPEERWVALSEYIRYLRTFFPPPPCPADLRTERCWYEDDDHYIKLSLMCRPISPPVLSKRARHETPRLGSTSSRASIPHTQSALTRFLDLHPISVHGVEDLPTPSMDDVLDLRLKFDSDTGAGIRSFLRSVLGPLTREKSVNWLQDTPHVPEFLSHDSPPRRPPSLDSPPLFARVAWGHSARSNAGNGVCNPTRVSDLASMLQAVSPELIPSEDGDINRHHMGVVDGWTTLAFSSPPPPSPHSSEGCEIDELWGASPPGAPAASVIPTKMDEVEIPRVRKFGYKNALIDESTNDHGTANLLTNNLGFLITSFISAPVPITQVAKPITSQLEGIRLSMHSPRPLSPGQSTSNSVLGQPPSAPEEQAHKESPVCPTDCVEDFEGQPFDDVIASIYASTPQDPLSYIREEKLDNTGIMLMDVPNLPPPTTHPKEPILFPEGMQNFVAPKAELASHGAADRGGSGFGLRAYLRPVKGIKPLALDLSWRPFNFGKTVPTDEEVAGIARLLQPEDEVPGYRDEYGEITSALPGLDDPPISAEDGQPIIISMVPRVCEEFGTSPTPKRAEEGDHVEYLLTQREMMRASTKITPETEIEVLDDMGIARDVPWSRNNERGDVFVQDETSRRNDEHEGSRILSDTIDQSWSHHGYRFDDSGIDILDNNLGQLSTGEFETPSLLLHSLRNNFPDAVDLSGVNWEDVDSQSENKENENETPRDPDDTRAAENQYDWNSYFEFPESETASFEPLSFASQSQLLGTSVHFTDSKAQGVRPLTPSEHHVQRIQEIFTPPNECRQTNSRATKRRKLDDLVPASSKDLFSTFIGLRNQATSIRTLEHSETQNGIPTAQDVPEQILPRVAPNDVLDPHTVRLPEHWIPAAAIHRYLASVPLIQKRALVHELQGHHYRVVLVERCDLGGTDIIIDPDHGVLFIPLFTLPAQLDSTIDRISRESWHYLNLLIVFEAFPSLQSYRVDHARDTRPVPYAYTPPMCKAIKKLRRNLGIAEGCGTMNPRCTVTWAFANNVEEAAKFVRCFGEEAYAISMERGNGVLWDERAWLEEEEREGESDLAKVHGMNAFAAFVMLYDRPLEAIFDMSPEARLAYFGQLLGQERVAELNATIESRIRQIAPDLADSVIDSRF